MGNLPGRSLLDRPSRWLTAPAAAVVLGGLAAVVGVLVSLRSHPDPMWLWLAVQPVGASFTAAGVIAWLRRPGNRSGLLMVGVGISWYLVDLRASAQPVWFGLGFCLFYLSPVVFTHLVLALPTGRLPGRAERLVAAALYVVALGTMILRYGREHPRGPQSWASPTAGYSIWATVGSVAGLALTLAAIGLVARRWRAASRPTRRTHALVWTTGAVIGLIVLGTILTSLLDASVDLQRQLGLVYVLLLVGTPFAILAGVLRVRMARIRVADLVMRLEASPEPAHLRDALADALADALGDPTLQVCFRLPATHDGPGGYVDADGRPLALSLPLPLPVRASRHASITATSSAAADGHGTGDGDGESGRAVTLVERQGEQLAALLHDPALTEQRSLVDAVVAAARLALENARLHAAQRAQLEEVLASRARIVAAADAERHRIQRDLHDGAQHQLLAVSILVGRVRAELPGGTGDSTSGPLALLDQATRQLHHVIRELRELTEGIHPPALIEQGLAAVVETLAERAPLPVRVQVPARRWPGQVERAAYFVINEALTNVYKHAGATSAEVRVAVAAGAGGRRLLVRVSDDGAGGADVDRGSGLRGLRDRVAAVGGTLRIHSDLGAGTQVVAELPCG